MKKNKNKEVYILLDNIRSVYNVGAIFRTAEASGVKKIFLTGLTPAPLDRFGNLRNDLSKTALGSENMVPWEYRKSAVSLIKKLKEEFFIVSVEQDETAVNYKKIKLNKKTLFVFGSETLGVSKNILKLSDQICELPMSGKKESLNVSVCVGIILYNFLN